MGNHDVESIGRFPSTAELHHLCSISDWLYYKLYHSRGCQLYLNRGWWDHYSVDGQVYRRKKPTAKWKWKPWEFLFICNMQREPKYNECSLLQIQLMARKTQIWKTIKL